MDQRRTIKIDPDVHRKVVKVATCNGFRISSFVEQAINEVIGQVESRASK
jgi:predicted HicB family RNase H-like nuclease